MTSIKTAIKTAHAKASRLSEGGRTKAPTRWSSRSAQSLVGRTHPGRNLAGAIAQLVDTERARAKLEVYRESPLTQLGSTGIAIITALAALGAMTLGAAVASAVSVFLDPQLAASLVGIGLLIPALFLLRQVSSH